MKRTPSLACPRPVPRLVWDTCLSLIRRCSPTAQVQESSCRLLPADIWDVIAREALLLDGCTVGAWTRLSLVNSGWQRTLAGASSSPIVCRVALLEHRYN